ncbi:hypothetical protein B0A53_03165 [Rhodotorula sp. CCFEE 5036]|nr:hypothetical protein B0A53_03165 [Rhodotorula sp. CCFEE 5036]
MLGSNSSRRDSNDAPAPPPGCLVTDADGTRDTTGMTRANDEFRRQGLGCVMRDTSRTGQRYELRVLGLLRDAWVESELRRWRDGAAVPDWFVFGDDDTWYSDVTMLREFLARHNPADEHFFGTFSETRQNYEYFGPIAFGGGGIIISRALLEKMQARVDECAVRFRDVIGGDGMISNCAALCRDYPLSKIVEEVPGLRQMDIQGDATGYLTDGSAPFLSLHHWTSWLQLMPGVPGLEAISLLSSAASVLGGPNFLRRWVFDGGLITWSAGYAVTIHRSALTAEELRQIEWTWNEHEPRKPARARRAEGIDKLTYYIAEVKELGPGMYLFRHTCNDPAARKVVREIDIVWDAREKESAASFLGSVRSVLNRYVVVAAALAAYVRAPSLEWLIASRVLFAIGGSTLITTMSALLLQMSAIPDEVIYGTTSPLLGSSSEPNCARFESMPPTEETGLLYNSNRRESTASWASARSFRKSSRSAGMLAFAGGLVFGFLRLPTLLALLSPYADPDSPEALRFGLWATFHVLAAIALLQALFLACVLPPSVVPNATAVEEDERSLKAAMWEAGGKLVVGFKLAARDGNIALGFASSFASRAQTTVTNAFLPLLIERYFSKYHLCDVTADDPLVGGRDSCRRAYILASALTGSVQLLSLVLSPLIGYAASSSASSRRTRHPQAALLGGASLLGAVAFVGYSALPNDGDPRSGWTWLYAGGVGFAQAAGVVLSLALVTTGRGIVTARSGNAAGGREIAGTLSGAYGFSGDLPTVQLAPPFAPSTVRVDCFDASHRPRSEMGQTLSEPVVDKHSQSGKDARLAWAVSEMQGWRLTMEDAHSAVLSLGDELDGKPTSFFAVYDGHGGSTVAKFAGDTVHSRLASNDHFKKRDWEASLKRAYLETDEDLRANPDFKGDPSGCTAVSTIITPEMNIICANAGDSRAVMSVGGEAKPLSFDHKPTNQGETSRIVAAGGFVEFGRVNGNLALSRALGDFDFKQSTTLDPEQQIVTADPDITVHTATPEDEFVVIACDGIWDVLTSQQVIDFVRLAISQGKSLQTICEEMLDRCLAPDSDWGGVGCDNMTMMVVALLGDRTEEEWFAWVKERVENGEGYPTPKEYVEPFGQGGNGPRGALMAGGSGGASGGSGSDEVAPSGILGGALRVGSLADGTVQLSFGGADGPNGIGEEDSEDDTELDLPTIQAALRARMAELEQEEAFSSSDAGAGAGAGAGAQTAAEGNEDEDDAMIEDADASLAEVQEAGDKSAAADDTAAADNSELDPSKLRTSHSPAEVVR